MYGSAICFVLACLSAPIVGASASTRYVETERDFLEALQDHSTQLVVLKKNLTLHSSSPEWQGTFHWPRNTCTLTSNSICRLKRTSAVLPRVYDVISSRLMSAASTGGTETRS